MKRIKYFVLALVLSGISAVALGPVSFAADTNKEAACKAIGGGANCVDPNKTDVNSVITTVVDVLSVIVGIVAVIMIIVAGFKYITSGGDSNKTASAKNTLIYAIVGIIIVALAQFIVNFAIDTTTA